MRANPRLVAFLDWLERSADPDELCSPPGIGGLWRAKFIRSGIKRGVITVHNSGEILAFCMPTSHGVCPDCARAKRSTMCSHCNCPLCIWEHESEERHSPKVSRQKMQDLALRMQAFAIGSGPQMAAPQPSLVD